MIDVALLESAKTSLSSVNVESVVVKGFPAADPTTPDFPLSTFCPIEEPSKRKILAIT